MTQAAPIWTSGMTVAFLPTCNSTKQGLPHGWSVHTCHPHPCLDMATCPRERGSCSVCPVIHHVLWKDMMVFPHISPNSKIHIFSLCLLFAGVCCYSLCQTNRKGLGFVSSFFHVPQPCQLHWCVCTPRPQHQRLPTALPFPPNGLHTHSHSHIPIGHWERKLVQLLSCCPRARPVWKTFEGTSVSSLERVAHLYDLWLNYSG